jgi:hypothetical protein
VAGKIRSDEQVPAPDSWGEVLGDTTVAAAMLDRLLHRSVVLNLDGALPDARALIRAGWRSAPPR